MGQLEKLRQLIALAQLQLLQTHTKGEWIVASKLVPQTKAQKPMSEKRAFPALLDERSSISDMGSVSIVEPREFHAAGKAQKLTSPQYGFDDLRQMLQAHCPEVALVDGEGSEVAIICQAHHPQEEKFWRHLAAAIHLCFNRRVQISYQRQAKEAEAAASKGYLVLIEEGTAPMLPGAVALNSAAAYLKQPAEKAKLWQKLTAAMSSPHV